MEKFGTSLPTKAQLQELKHECTWVWNSAKKGFDIEGSNGNSIFLPAAGYRDGLSLEEQSMSGLYWSSWLYGSSPAYAGCLNFQPQFQSMGNSPRSDGYPIRPVQ